MFLSFIFISKSVILRRLWDRLALLIISFSISLVFNWSWSEFLSVRDVCVSVCVCMRVCVRVCVCVCFCVCTYIMFVLMCAINVLSVYVCVSILLAFYFLIFNLQVNSCSMCVRFCMHGCICVNVHICVPVCVFVCKCEWMCVFVCPRVFFCITLGLAAMLVVNSL